MEISLGSRRTAFTLLAAAGVFSISSAALAQNAPPPDYSQPPPGYQQQPPPGYQQPPPGYQQQPPPGYQQQPPPAGYQQPPAAYAPPPGYAAPPAPPTPQHTGFYLRIHIGPGYGKMSATDGYGTAFSGGGLSFGLAFGGSVAPNFIIFGNLFGMGLSDPDLELNGQSAGSTSNLTTTIAGIGPGVAYYFQPINMYISGTIGVMEFQGSNSSSGGTSYNSNAGWGFQGMVGKEWWVTPTWGLGVAGEILAAGGMADKDNSAIKWSGDTFSIVFSATYN
jgi:hypothetical protein